MYIYTLHIFLLRECVLNCIQKHKREGEGVSKFSRMGWPHDPSLMLGMSGCTLKIMNPSAV